MTISVPRRRTPAENQTELEFPQEPPTLVPEKVVTDLPGEYDSRLKVVTHIIRRGVKKFLTEMDATEKSTSISPASV